MKKKFITTLLAISMISLTACGAKIEQTADTNSPTVETTEIAEPTETAESVENIATEIEESLAVRTNAERGNSVGDAVENIQGSESVDTNENTETDIFDKAKEHCTFEYGYDENGKKQFTLEYATYTMTDEFKEAILELIPDLKNYPDEYVDEQLKSISREVSWLDDGESLDTDKIKKETQLILDEYYKYGYDEIYGPVKGHEETTNNNETTNNQGNTSTENKAPSAGNNNNGVTPQDPNRVYETKSEVTLYDVVYRNTGEYIDGKAVYEDDYGNRCHIDVDGGVDIIDTSSWVDDVEHYEGGAKFTDHIRE